MKCRAVESLEKVWLPLRGLIGICIVVIVIFYTYPVNHSGIEFQGRLKTMSLLKKSTVAPNENPAYTMKNDSVVIVVQVHNRLIYLQHLIKSLRKVANISQALLIFSHDYNDKNINKLIRQIDFCKVLQIFYPYSLQKYEHEFPGPGKNDCPPDISPQSAIRRKCANAYHPDHYGHYRDAKNVQAKLHWWWKLNQVFDHLDVTKYFAGLVMFLEEDHYVSQDILHVLKLMQNQSAKLCPACKVFAVGNHLELNVYEHTKPDRINVSPWQHNAGFSFNRSVWNEIRSCGKTFCQYDDYCVTYPNNVFLTCYLQWQSKEHVFFTLANDNERFCSGMHIRKSNGDPTSTLSKIRTLNLNALKFHEMYPKKLSLSWMTTNTVGFNMNGGWSDIRDHSLCLSFMRNATAN